MDIYVGNLPYTATEEDVTELFASYGPVDRVKIITDRETGRSKGFAFVTLGDQSHLNAAIEALDGFDFQGRALRVNASEPKEPRPGGFRSGGGRRGLQQRWPAGCFSGQSFISQSGEQPVYKCDQRPADVVGWRHCLGRLRW